MKIITAVKGVVSLSKLRLAGQLPTLSECFLSERCRKMESLFASGFVAKLFIFLEEKDALVDTK